MSGSVLVVEDSLTVRMDLLEGFEEAAVPAVGCATLEAARRALAERGFGLVVLDVLLPDGNGVDFLAELRSAPATAELPVLLLSSEAEVRDRIRGVRMGADDYVGKPYDRPSLLARAQDLLRRRAPAARLRPLVLVVDDSRSLREAFRADLEAAGYDVLLAGSGEEGLGLAATSRPDALVVDGTLPGIDGATFVRRLRMDPALRRTPALLLTGSEAASYEITALEAGADNFMRKTEDLSEVLVRLAAVIRAVSPTAELGLVPSLFSPKRVLAVDDSPTYLHELAERIREEGYDVILAASGGQALELLEAQLVDCILLDLVMPGLSGEETCRRIKRSQELREIPLVMLTAQEGQETMIQAFNAGADDYIPKSSDFEVIRARLRAQIRRKHFEDENKRIREELLQKEREAVEARAARDLAQARGTLLKALEEVNHELEAFSYSVSHDLRGPLRAIGGFTALLESGYAERLDAKGQGYIRRVQESVLRMSELIEGLLVLSRLSRKELRLEPVDLSALVRQIADGLLAEPTGREVEFRIQPGLQAEADGQLVRAVLENLVGNAWKYSAKHPRALIEFGAEAGEGEGGVPVYFVRDDGAGFDMHYADKLFTPFQRLHHVQDFEGSGIGLATVHRAVRRHGGRIWAEAEVEKGATFRFTLREAAGPGC